MINGLHTCKPQNTPRVGDVKPFLCVPTPTRDGKKTYTKIKNPQRGENAPLYNIVSVEKTNYSDSNGNVSFNLTLEPTQGQPQPMQFAYNGPQTHQEARQQAFQEPVVKDTPRQHLMRVLNLYKLCWSAVDSVLFPNGTATAADEEAWKMAIGQVFKHMSSKHTDDGQNWYSYVDQMPATPMKASNEASMPETEEQGEYTPFEPREEEPF